jgi:hypothetical protein
VAFDGEGFGHVALFEDDLESFADGKIVDGQDVGPAKVENEQHLDGPATNAFDFREPRKDFLVAESVHLIQFGNRAGVHARGEVADVSGFRARKTDAPECFGVSSKDFLGAREIAVWEQGAEAAEDGFGGAVAELLVGDGAHERFEA